MANCRVCWTCRGLFTDHTISDYKVKSHLKSCNGTSKVSNTDLFEYFACDRTDYSALKNLKKSLNKHVMHAFSSFNGLATVPSSLIVALQALCASDFDMNGVKQPLLLSQDSNSPKGKIELFRDTIIDDEHCYGNSDKACQTTIHRAQPVIDINSDDCSKGIVIDDEEDEYNHNSNKRKTSQPVIHRACSTPDTDSVDSNQRNISCTMKALTMHAVIDLESHTPCSEVSKKNGLTAMGSIYTSDMSSSKSVFTIQNDITELMKDPVSQVKEMMREDEKKLSSQCSIQKVNQDSNYVCKLCSYKTNSDKRMLRHLDTHNNGQPFECSSCSFMTIWRKEWKQHLQRKHGEVNITCIKCGTEFVRKDMYEEHITSIHPELAYTIEKNKFQCDQCDYVTGKLLSLKEHKRKHTGEVLACSHEGCGFKTMYSRSLQKHLKQKHADEKNLTCHVCGFRTRHSSSLSKHMMLLHREFKPYKCAQCSFAALYPSEVIAHAKCKHLKQKRFSCPFCKFQTSYPLAIQKHLQRHRGTRGYSCTVCGEALDSVRKAKKHMKNDHGCAGYKIINESVSEKVKPGDYKINPGEKSKADDAFHVMIISTDLVNNDLVTENPASGNDMNPEEDLVDDILIAQTEDISEDMITSSLDHDTSLYGSSTLPSKGGNPMLSATTNDLVDTDNSLIDDSLFDLMSDFPRPPALNRSQSASTLMFASFSPHLIDRPMTPDFFTDSPSVGSFFPTFPSKSLDSESLALGSLSSFDGPSQPLSVPSSGLGLTASNSSIRVANPPSPILPSFISSPVAGTAGPPNAVSMPTSLIPDTGCMDVDSILPGSVLSTLSQLSASDAGIPDSPAIKLTGSSFVRHSSAFSSLSQDFSPEIQAAVASIPAPEETDSSADVTSCMTEESPFPDSAVL